MMHHKLKIIVGLLLVPMLASSYIGPFPPGGPGGGGGGGTASGISSINGNSNSAQTIAGGTNVTVSSVGGTTTISSSGSGNVTGPASVTSNGNIAIYNGTTGKIIQDSKTNINPTTGQISETFADSPSGALHNIDISTQTTADQALKITGSANLASNTIFDISPTLSNNTYQSIYIHPTTSGTPASYTMGILDLMALSNSSTGLGINAKANAGVQAVNAEATNSNTTSQTSAQGVSAYARANLAAGLRSLAQANVGSSGVAYGTISQATQDGGAQAVGGYFAIGTTDTSAFENVVTAPGISVALAADNGNTAGTIFTALSNGSSVFSITPTSVSTNIPLTDSIASVGTAATDGIVVTNPTAAAAGAQQYSPVLRLTGNGWKTQATSASRPVDWTLQTVPVQSSVAPSSYLSFSSQINGGGYTNRMAITSAGNVGIGTTTPANPLSVVGVIQSTSGGFKFPDNTTQATASPWTVVSGTSIYYNNAGSTVGINTGGSATEAFQVMGGGLIGLAPTTLTTLNGAINNSVTTITVISTSGYPQVGTIRLEGEAISYTAVTATQFQGCTRGVYGTTAASHADTTTVDSYLFVATPTRSGVSPPLSVTANNGSGLVGINTVPTANLEIFGVGNPQNLYLGFATMVRSSVASEGPWQYIFSNANAGASHDFGLYLADLSADAGTLVFAPGDGAGGYVNAMAIRGTSGNLGVKTLSPAYDLEVVGNSATGHLVGNTSAPTIAAGTGAGTSPSVVTVTGTDLAGLVSITTGTAPAGTNATVATITFNAAYGAAPECILGAENGTTALLSGVTAVFTTETTTTFLIKSGTTGLTGATAYIWKYHCIQ